MHVLCIGDRAGHDQRLAVTLLTMYSVPCRLVSYTAVGCAVDGHVRVAETGIANSPLYVHFFTDVVLVR